MFHTHEVLINRRVTTRPKVRKGPGISSNTEGRYPAGAEPTVHPVSRPVPPCLFLAVGCPFQAVRPLCLFLLISASFSETAFRNAGQALLSERRLLMIPPCHLSHEVARFASSSPSITFFRASPPPSLSRCLLRPGTGHGWRRYGEVARPRVGVFVRAVHGPFRPQRSRSLNTRGIFFLSGTGWPTARDSFLSEIVRVSPASSL